MILLMSALSGIVVALYRSRYAFISSFVFSQVLKLLHSRRPAAGSSVISQTEQKAESERASGEFTVKLHSR